MPTPFKIENLLRLHLHHCDTGRTTEQMLAALKDLLNNSPNAEIRIAAEQQRQITRLRLLRPG